MYAMSMIFLWAISLAVPQNLTPLELARALLVSSRF